MCVISSMIFAMLNITIATWTSSSIRWLWMKFFDLHQSQWITDFDNVHRNFLYRLLFITIGQYSWLVSQKRVDKNRWTFVISASAITSCKGILYFVCVVGLYIRYGLFPSPVWRELCLCVYKVWGIHNYDYEDLVLTGSASRCHTLGVTM